MEASICGVNEEYFAINGVTYQWPVSINPLKWSFNFSRLGNLSAEQFKAAATQWFAEITAACNRQFEYTDNPRLANILYTSKRLDGPSGVLAQMQIPMGNVSPGTQLVGEFDDSEVWGLFDGPSVPQGPNIDLYRTGLHETLHAMGLGHEPPDVTAPSVIAPIYSQTIRHLQDIDKSELVRRYGPPLPTAGGQPSVPAGTVPPIGGTVNVTIEQDGKIWGGSLPRLK